VNATESLIYITVCAHRFVAWEEHAGRLPSRSVCRCFWVGDDHDEHGAQEVARALLPDAQPKPAGVERGVGWSQEHLFEDPPAKRYEEHIRR
jgi:hypothetical protein